ncbi:MAG TPA: type II toxin-antitoxin system RelE/ParE family toxin [Xanthobacteraceae bacterium]|jgi:plasmid stabilization system protein ParE
MNRGLIIEPEAEAEIEETSRWYDLQNPGLGSAFLRAVETALSTIQTNPLQYQIVYKQVRRAGLGRFPQGLMYVVSEREIIVLGCIHGRRDPRRWQKRV